jgi:hypothetical protein
MNKRMTIGILGAVLTLGVAFAAAGPNASATRQQMPMRGEMSDMSKMHQQMMADMKAEQAKLDALVQKMNVANGNAKVNAMADLLTELVREHGAMADRMGTMNNEMMRGAVGRGSDSR